MTQLRKIKEYKSAKAHLQDQQLENQTCFCFPVRGRLRQRVTWKKEKGKIPTVART